MTENDNNIDNVRNSILKALKKATKQCQNTVLKSKTKSTSTEYDEDLKKPIFEETTETEKINTVNGVIDISSLKTIADIFKEINDIKSVSSEKSSHQAVILADIKELDND